MKTLKNAQMPGAKERAAEHTAVCEQHSDAGNAADGRFSAFSFGAAGQFSDIPGKTLGAESQPLPH
jgi:hypothetical protein